MEGEGQVHRGGWRLTVAMLWNDKYVTDVDVEGISFSI